MQPDTRHPPQNDPRDWGRSSVWFIEVFRAIAAVSLTAIGGLIGSHIDGGDQFHAEPVGIVLGCLAGYVLGGTVGRFTVRAVNTIEHRATNVPAHELLAGIIGVTFGIFLGGTLAAPMFLFIPTEVAFPLASGTTWLTAWAGMRIAVDRSDDLFAAAGLSTRPLVRAETWRTGDGVIVDTSAVMEGPLRVLVDAGIVDFPLLLPVFVLDELQSLSDAEGPRGRLARRGLETLETLRNRGHRIEVLHDELPDIDHIDAKLIALARRLRLRILTTDENLAANAELQGVPVTNLRQLANSFTTERAPGEHVDVDIVRHGKEAGQGVGYLDDGTMVVVADAHTHIGGPAIVATITAAVPTIRGRMLFARIADHDRS